MKKFLILLLALLCVSFPALAKEYVIDEADLLSSQEEAALERTIASIAQEYDLDIALAFKNSIQGRDVMRYAADYYIIQGFGRGANQDGMLFLLTMEEREYTTVTHGSAIQAFTDYGLDQIHADITPYLTGGEYAQAMERYLVHVENYLRQARTGPSFDVDNPVRRTGADGLTFSTHTPLTQANDVFPIILIIALVIALIVVFVMKGQMKTIRKKAGAASYVKEGSFRLTRQQDIYLYTTTRRRKIESNSGGSGGSSTFRSSSGGSFGGRSGKF